MPSALADFVVNGAPHGDVANRLMDADFDPGILRPFKGDDGRSYITINANTPREETMVTNAPATLRKDEWIQLDQAVIRIARQRLKAFADLRARGLVYNIPNGMGKTVLQYEAQSDITPATISMDPVRQSEEDRPHYALRNLPLPVIHKDFSFTAREIAVSRNGGSPLDTTTAELAGRKVAEEIEKLTIGTSSFAYGEGGGEVFGYTNFPHRITKTNFTAPTAGGWTGATLVNETLALIQLLYDANYYGPFNVYFSRGWAQYLGQDYSTAKGDNTVRQRLSAIDEISGIQVLDYLTGYQVVAVQMTSDVVRAVVGMEVNTIQWETQGGMRQHFKVMAIQLPQLRQDFEDTAGVAHGTTG